MSTQHKWEVCDVGARCIHCNISSDSPDWVTKFRRPCEGTQGSPVSVTTSEKANPGSNIGARNQDADAIYSLTSKVDQMAKDISHIKSLVAASMQPRWEVPSTPAVYGEEMRNLVPPKNFVPRQGEVALMAASTAAAIKRFISEPDLVNFCFEHLQAKLPDDLRLVSSENNKWLKTSSRDPNKDQKPDLFVVHRALYLKKISNYQPANVVCGVPASLTLLDCIKIIDFNCSYTDTAYGELLIHLNLIVDNIRQHHQRKGVIVTRGALALNDCIWLVECAQYTPISVLKMNWTDAGSAAEFAKFFCDRSELGTNLDDICSKMGVTVVETHQDSGKIIPCFLGAGAMGKVFRVRNSTGAEFALKIVIGETDSTVLEHESALLEVIGKDLQYTSQPLIVTCHKFERLEQDDSVVCAALLMSPIGKMVSVNAGNVKMAMEALRQLHLLGYCHGDARLPNMLAYNDRVLLCDLRTSFLSTAGVLHTCRADMETFIKSLGIAPDPSLRRLISDYDPSNAVSFSIFQKAVAKCI